MYVLTQGQSHCAECSGGGWSSIKMLPRMFGFMAGWVQLPEFKSSTVNNLCCFRKVVKTCILIEQKSLINDIVKIIDKFQFLKLVFLYFSLKSLVCQDVISITTVFSLSYASWLVLSAYFALAFNDITSNRFLAFNNIPVLIKIY